MMMIHAANYHNSTQQATRLMLSHMEYPVAWGPDAVGGLSRRGPAATPAGFKGRRQARLPAAGLRCFRSSEDT